MDERDEPPDDLRVRLRWPGISDDDIDVDQVEPRALKGLDQPAAAPPDTSDAPVDTPADREVDADGDDQPTDVRAGVDEAATTTDAGPEPEMDFEVADEIDPDEVDDDDNQPGSDGLPGGSRELSTQQLILAGRSDSLQAALASIAIRIDALTSTTSTFRSLISDRVTDYADQVGRFSHNAANDLEDYRHLHERSLEEVRRHVSDANDNVRLLSRIVGDVELKTAALIASVRENADAVDHLAGERDQMSDTVLRSLDRVSQQLELGLERGLDQGLEATAASLSRLEEAVERLADEREPGADTLQRLEATLADLSASRERGAAKAMARLEGRLGEVATAVGELAAQDLSATLRRLDARLREIQADPTGDRAPAPGGPRLASLERGPDGGGAAVDSDRHQQLLERVDQVGQQLGEQLESLRRRIALRARPAAQTLDDGVIDAIAEAVVARLSAAGRPVAPPRPALAPSPISPRPILRSGEAVPEPQAGGRGPRGKRL